MRIFTDRGFGEPLVKKARNDDMTEVQMDEFGVTETIVTDDVAENTESISTKSRHVQSSLDTFVGTPSEEKGEIDVHLDKRSLDYVAEKLAERLTITQRSPFPNPSPNIKVLASSSGSERPATTETRLSAGCEDLIEFLKVETDYELISEGDVHIIHCKLCFRYLSDPVSSSSLKRKPSTTLGSSLATGLSISDKDYRYYCAGGCQPWYRMKNRLLSHVMDSTQTHVNAILYARELKTVESRQQTVVRNQLRTAIGIVQAKAAAVHYENRIADCTKLVQM